MRRLALVAALLAAGCASTPVQRDDPALAAADAQVLQGCYDCLLQARDTYARLLAAPHALPVLTLRLFETELLLALREKALALDSSASMARVRALVPQLPDGIDGARYLRIVDDVLPNDIGTPTREFHALVASHRSDEPGIDDDVRWLEAGPLRAPVRLAISFAIDCSHWPRQRTPGRLSALPPGTQPRPPADRTIDPDAPPLVQFAYQTCNGAARDLKALDAIGDEVPAFVETNWFHARATQGRVQREGPAEPRSHLLLAYARFPKSPAITYLLGNLDQLAGDCAAALPYFDQTVALSPAHENGWLGRTTCLSTTGHHEEGIASATHMIDAGLRPADGYYWRAWNHRELGQLALARADINAGKALGFDVDIFRLAGIIEHDQNDLAPAEADLLAVERSREAWQDCVTRWYLGLVYVKGKRFGDAGSQFVDAVGCYQTSVGLDQAQLADWQKRADIDPDFRADQVKAFEAAVTSDESQAYAAAFNAANYSAQGGHLEIARRYLEIAAKDPALADLVRQLRAIIKTPNPR